MLTIQSFTFNPFQENTYLVYDETKECLVIDPGCYEKYEQKELSQFIENNNLKVTKLINTHCHIDHVLGNEYIKQTYDVKLWVHPIEIPYLKATTVYAPNYGFNFYEASEPEHTIEENTSVTVGNQSLETLFVPGHSPGHIALYHPETKSCLAGDVLFQNSIGRSDLPGGNFDTLIRSIKDKLFTLPNETVIFPGHGPTTTIGEEKKSNPFLNPI